MKVSLAPQGSAAWLEERAGLITASRIKDVMSVLKNGGETQARYNYKWEIVSERISGFTTEHYVSPDMERGSELEPIARAEHEIESGLIVDQVGMVYHPTIARSAASPDGLIDDDGAAEYKCPRVTTQLKWIQAGVVPPEHEWQCLWVMDCCERDWLDFCSFEPSLPDGLRLFKVRMPRDEERIARIRAEVTRLDDEVEAIIAELSKRVKVDASWSRSPEAQQIIAAPREAEQAPPLDQWASAFELGEELNLS